MKQVEMCGDVRPGEHANQQKAVWHNDASALPSDPGEARSCSSGSVGIYDLICSEVCVYKGQNDICAAHANCAVLVLHARHFDIADRPRAIRELSMSMYPSLPRTCKEEDSYFLRWSYIWRQAVDTRYRCPQRFATIPMNIYKVRSLA